MGVTFAVELLCLLLVKYAPVQPVGLHVHLIRLLELTQLALSPEWMFRVPGLLTVKLFQLRSLPLESCVRVVTQFQFVWSRWLDDVTADVSLHASAPDGT